MEKKDWKERLSKMLREPVREEESVTGYFGYFMLDGEFQEILEKRVVSFIEKELKRVRKDALKDLKQELFTFFRWFQWNGEKYMDKPIEEMIKVYLEERK